MVRHYDVWSGQWIYSRQPVITSKTKRKKITQKQVESAFSGIGKKFVKARKQTSQKKQKLVNKLKYGKPIAEFDKSGKLKRKKTLFENVFGVKGLRRKPVYGKQKKRMYD